MSDNMINNETETPTSDVDTAVDNGAAEADVAPTGVDLDTDGQGDMFPRKVVEKLRRESADHRGRANAAEEQLTAMQARAEAAEGRLTSMQRQSAEGLIKAAGMRAEAVWAVAQLDDLLAHDGTVDEAKVAHAMATARRTLGIQTKRNPAGIRNGFHSGVGGPREYKPGPAFSDAFRPRKP